MRITVKTDAMAGAGRADAPGRETATGRRRGSRGRGARGAALAGASGNAGHLARRFDEGAAGRFRA